MADMCELCQQVKQIVGGKAECEEGICSVSVARNHIHATILERPVKSAGVLGIELTFEDLAADGTALCLGEVTLLEAEVGPFIRPLSRQGIRLTAIHNHWLEDRPRLIYVHFQAIMNPVRFARALAPMLTPLTA